MNDVVFREAVISDLAQLLVLEEQCFSSDRLSKRSFRHYIRAENCLLWVAEVSRTTTLVGYALVWCHKGKQLARLYSLAISPLARGQGIAQHFLAKMETEAAKRGRSHMRLEVAEKNHAAITLYRQSGYRVFGGYHSYYEDKSAALRMQKRIAPDSVLSPAHPAPAQHPLPLENV